MSRKPAVSALEHIPAVREALKAVGLEMVVRPIQTTPAEVKPAALVPYNPSHTTPAQLQSAWAAEQSAEVDAAIQAEKARTAPREEPPKRPTRLPAAQRRAVEAGLLMDAGVRDAKLAQFRNDGGATVAEAHDVGQEVLSTLSEAT